MSMLEHALAYASRGWPVFPCSPNDKRPLIKGPKKGEGGYKLATTDADQIRRWWTSWPEAMIGVPTGKAVGAVVMDIDPKDGATAEAVLADICALIGTRLPPAPMTRTPRGGLHLWFAVPADVTVTNRAGIIPGVDVRGDGRGYVIFPPSVRRGPKAVKDGCDGVAYRWEEDASLDDFPPPAAPEALLAFFTDKQSARSADAVHPSPAPGGAGSSPGAGPAAPLPENDPRAAAVRKFVLAAFDAELAKVTGAPQGQRNNILNNAAIALGQLVAAGALAEASVRTALEQAAAGLAKDDGIRSVRATIDSGLRLGLSQPRDLSQVGAKAGRPRPGPGPSRRAARSSGPTDEGPSYGSDPAAPGNGDANGSRGSRDRGSTSGGGSGEPPAGAVDYGDEFGPPTVDQWCSWQPQNDLGNASRFLGRYGNRVMFVLEVGWHVWAGTHWEEVAGKAAARRMAHRTSELIAREAAWIFPTAAERAAIEDAATYRAKPPDQINAAIRAMIARAEAAEDRLAKRIDGRRKFGVSSGNTSRLSGMVTEVEARATVAPDVLDADPLSVNVLNGTLRFVSTTVTEPDPDAPAYSDGMRTVKRWSVRLDPHQPSDRISKVMPVIWEPGATCPKFTAFMERLQPRAAVHTFLRDFYGYSLLGLTGFQAFVFHYGHGANGKSTFMETMARLQGPYGRVLPAEALTGDVQKSSSQASPEFARLPGARMVRCAELPRGHGFRESVLKALTGGEPMLVRNNFQGFFEFRPVFKVTGSGNDKPSIGGVDEGIWRRMKLIPWTQTIPEDERRDMEEVLAEFMEEASGILNWLVAGALAYLEGGMQVPSEIRQATETYREEMDPVGEFLKACTARTPGTDTSARDLYLTYKAWCEENSVRPYSEKGFAGIMLDKGYEKKNLRVRQYSDLSIVYSPQPEKDGAMYPRGYGGPD